MPGVVHLIMRKIKTSALLLIAATLVLGASAPQEDDVVFLSLDTVFDRGAIFQDRNSDEVIDFVNARFVLGNVPTPTEITAAAEVAARLGFETMALDLPLPRSAGEGTMIAIGRAGVSRARLSEADLRLDTLLPGEGLVTVGHLANDQVLVIAGGDDRGTLAAARLLAGRLPHVWDPKGPTLTDVLTNVRDFLSDAGVVPAGMAVENVHVKAEDNAIDRLTITVQMSSAADSVGAETALNRLADERITSPNQEAVVDDESEPELSYSGARIVRINLFADSEALGFVDVPRAAPPADKPLAPRPGSSVKRSLDLSSVYSSDGFLGDANSDLISDRTDVVIVPSGAGTDGTIDLAARIGLEVTGLSIPLVRTVDEIDAPGSEPTLVLVGTPHPLVDELVADGKLTLPTLQSGQGLIRVVPKAFGSKSAVVITGADASGVARALEQVTERFPHVWQRGKDRTTLDQIESDLRNVLTGRSPAGQAATALYKLDQVFQELSQLDLESAEVTVYVDKPESGFGVLVQETAVQQLTVDHLNVRVESLDVQEAKPISVNGAPISAEFDIPSEVDEFWRILRSQVMPSVTWDEPVVVMARLSEPPPIRSKLEQQAVQELVDAGARLEDVSVTITSAYKQGFSWLYDIVRPRLSEQPVDNMLIRYAEIGPPEDWQQQAMFTPTRWLLELHPIDEILANELNLTLEKIVFEKMPIGSPTYEVIARDANNVELLRETFEPKFVLRSFFDQFPDYEKVRVTTGWISAQAGDRQIVDTRIVTDLERFWDYFQGTTLPAIYDYVMELHEGKPLAADAPHFGELRVQVTLSESDYQLGIDQEQIAPMESLHEEIYFSTLHFFDVLGRFTRGQPLNYPGRVIPIVKATSDGLPGRAAISFTGFGSSRPAVNVDYRERNGRLGTKRRDIPKVSVERPRSLSAQVSLESNGLEKLDLRVKVDTQHDEWAELALRTRVESVDAQIMSAEQVMAVVANLNLLRAAGLYRDALAYHDVGVLQVSAGWEHDIDVLSEPVTTLTQNGQASPFPAVTELLRDAPVVAVGEGPLVQWDTPIPPSEAYALLAMMAEYPEATTYQVGKSYLGKDVWAMDLMSPIEASHWSHTKATTFKPTVIYSARQHANEVSSTSHVLRLAELLLTDSSVRQQLDKVNVVIHPITNADGAQLAYDLAQQTPNHMLHAGYLGALGVDVGAGQWESDPLYPESTIRPELWRTWLPDIFLNPHGYPSHEWVQLFSEYAGWVRNRVTQSRSWWGMRGWFIPGFRYLDDPRYPRHKSAAFEIRDLITEHINALPEIRAFNDRAYARYRRYGFAHDNENFKLDFSDDVLIYTGIKGARVSPGSRSFMARNPRVTIWSGSTEAPDETARGDWMKLVAAAGLQWDKAILKYLAEGQHVVERDGSDFFGGVRLTMFRPRPPKVDDAE